MSRPRELLTDYARGVLSEADRIRLEEHLRTCSACRSEVRSVNRSFVELVEGLPRERVPAEAWSAILARIRRGRMRTTRRMAWGLAAALALLAVSGLWSMLALERERIATTEAATVARWLARDDVRRLPLELEPSAGPGSVLLLPDGRALFVLSRAPDRGNAYQAWGHRDGTPVSLGVFGRPVFEVAADEFEAVGVSLEPPGGSPRPTRPLGRAQLP